MALAMVLPALPFAQSYPTKPIRLIAPFPTGASQISSESDMVVVTLPATIPFINAGRLRGLAVLDTRRVPQLPQLPTSIEAGMPDLQLITWYGVATPAGVRNDIIERLHKELAAAMQSADVKQRFARVGIDAASSTPAEFGEYIRAEVARWAKVIREAKIQFD